MQSYEICWAFLLNYDKNSKQLNIEFSDQFMIDNHLEQSHMTFHDDEICTFLHRYDCRKLGYFCETNIKDTFDTLMRFTIKKSKYPLRTIAICKLNDRGMSCIHFEEAKLVRLRKLKLKDKPQKISKLIDIANSKDLSTVSQRFFSKIDQYLAKIIERNQEMV
ncbi:MAG: hypothetical protein K9L02_03405 [Acholeplasmataceae bacterium]|nr:hypothetical protein [Acholeplasmataceae bacterium]